MPTPEYSEHHVWVGAATVRLDVRQARRASMRHNVRYPREMSINVLEVYCFSADTRFITREGIRTLGECAGTTQTVLTQEFTEGRTQAGRSDGRWVEADISPFGEQPLLRLHLTRDGVRKTIRTTPNHRWIAKRSDGGSATPKILETSELQPGMVLCSLTPRDQLRQSQPSTFGIAHGIVYGDGARKNQRGSTVGTGSYVDLWGEKNMALVRYFNDAPTTPMKTPSGSGLDGVRVNHLPSYFKERPSLDESVSYLYGWLAGYFAADGTVGPTGKPSMASARREDLEFAQVVATRLGIVTYGIAANERVGYGTAPSMLYTLSFDRSTMRPEFFLIDEHRARVIANPGAHNRLRWRVETVEDAGDVEEVFCATVPDTSTFALEDFIWTHNCEQCRRPWDDVADDLCVAAKDNKHLRGGTIERRKRAHHKHNCDALGCEPPADDGEEPLSATG